MGVILFIVAAVLSIVLAVPGFIASFIYMFIAATKGKFLKSLYKANDDLFFSAALAIDQFGNVFFQHLFNITLIKYKVEFKINHLDDGNIDTELRDNPNRFGNPDETISSVLGKNKRENTLTKTGKALDWILDKLDPNHSIKSIEENP